MNYSWHITKLGLTDKLNRDDVLLENAIVRVQLEGACMGCSVNQMTLKNGVEATIKKYAPQIQEVINVA